MPATEMETTTFRHPEVWTAAGVAEAVRSNAVRAQGPDSRFARDAAELESCQPRGRTMSKFRGELKTPEEWESDLLAGRVTLPGWTVTPNLVTTIETTMPASANRKHIICPPDHWEAFQKSADSAGIPLSEWVGQACLKQLPSAVRKTLSDRPGPGQPKKVSENS